jgi:hypothetical protein
MLKHSKIALSFCRTENTSSHHFFKTPEQSAQFLTNHPSCESLTITGRSANEVT